MEKLIRLRNATVALEDTGEGSAILLLHGFPATRGLWSRIAPKLVGQGFRVLVPDLVGYGNSRAAPGTRVDMLSQARWMLELLDAMRVARAVVVAHDVGAAAAQIMMVRARGRLRALAVLDGVHGREWAIDLVDGIRAWAPSDAYSLFPALASRLGESSGIRRMLAAYEGEEGGLRLITAARDLDPRQIMGIASFVRACAVPALVLWGERDEQLPVERVARPLAELLGAPLHLLPGGHFTPFDCPQQVVARLQSFLAGLPHEA
jgi:pimeloyl-ACP methyl ester carboxylesterase